MKVVIAGSGFMGSTHAEGYAKLGDVQILGFVGRTERRRKELAEKYGTEHFGSLEEALEKKPDIVDICLPSPMNVESVEKSARAGAHILLEKPIALALEEADQIIETVRKHNVKLMIAHVLQFWPEYVKIREVLLEGTLGKPLTASAIRVCESPRWGSWFTDFSQSGGVARNMIIHDFDMCNWLFGKPVRVYATATEAFDGGWFDMNAMVTYENGVSATIKGSQMMTRGYPFTMGLRIQGTKATVDFLFRVGANLQFRDQAEKEFKLYRDDGTASELEAEGGDAYEAEVSYFVDCVKNDREPDRGRPEDARLALEVALACEQSAEEGRSIEL